MTQSWNISGVDDSQLIDKSRYVNALRTKLRKANESSVITLLADSTSNATNEWFYLAMQEVIKHNPAYTALYRLWNDTKQAYDDPSYLQFGSNGHGYAQLSGGYLSIPDAVSLRLTGDIEVIMKVNAVSYKSGVDQILASKFGATGNRGWVLAMNGAGYLYFWWSADGTNFVGGAGTGIQSTSSIPVSNGQDVWIKAVLDVDNGAGGVTAKYYTSQNGQTWTQLGPDMTLAGTSSIFATTANVEIGSRSSGTGVFTGKIYATHIKNGIDGVPVVSADFGMAHPSVIASMSDMTGKSITTQGNATWGNGSPTLFLFNGSTPGQNAQYSTDATRFPLQVPIRPDLALISYCHNDGANRNYYANYEALLDKMITTYPRIGIACLSQNPRRLGTEYYFEHAMRNSQIGEIAAYKKLDFVDIYSAFLDINNINSLVQVDGVHPSDEGEILWSNTILKYLKPILF